ncbi:MAG TPA: hypothetical protein VJO16_19280 [Candidatus Acidoferrum sp.]|nr:hypothetical protein [Candidatus Acidoferrum sp.]
MRFQIAGLRLIAGCLLLLAAAPPNPAQKANQVSNPPTPSNVSNAGPCTNRKLPRYQISSNSSGETVEGPACVETTSNTLRNSIYITTAITQTAGPSPASILPGAGDKSVGGGGGSATLAVLEGRVRTAQNELRLRLDDNRTAAAHLGDVIARLREFILHSDESVAGGRFDILAGQIKTRKDELDVIANGSSWKATDDIVRMVHAAQNDWANFAVDHPEALNDPDPAKKAESTNKYNALKTQLDDLETKALQQASGSDASKAIGKDMGLIVYWRDVLAGFLEQDGSLPKEPAGRFVVHQDVPCRTVFNMNRSTAVKLTVGDRLPFFDGQQMSSQTHDAFVTVTCTSPFSLSAGVAFSSIEQREFAIVQSAPAAGSTTLVSKFGYSSKSAFHPLPLAMAHMRFYESESHRYAVHATFGIAANIQGTNAGGSNAEYLPGLSFSLFRTMYLTAGVHIGKQASLAGGFNVGDVVPAGITSPPLQTSYKAGAGFAVTFTKP